MTASHSVWTVKQRRTPVIEMIGSGVFLVFSSCVMSLELVSKVVQLTASVSWSSNSPCTMSGVEFEAPAAAQRPARNWQLDGVAAPFKVSFANLNYSSIAVISGQSIASFPLLSWDCFLSPNGTSSIPIITNTEFAMSLAQEWESWKTPTAKEVKAAPKPGEKAPVNENFHFKTDKPTLVVFMRHCGCPCKSALDA